MSVLQKTEQEKSVLLSPIGVVGVLALIIFHLVLGWKVYRLSRVA
jgi:hypothetical protein